MAFLQGDSGKASGLLIRASGEAKALKPNPAMALRLMRQWRMVKFEVLQRKVRELHVFISAFWSREYVRVALFSTLYDAVGAAAAVFFPILISFLCVVFCPYRVRLDQSPQATLEKCVQVDPHHTISLSLI